MIHFLVKVKEPHMSVYNNSYPQLFPTPTTSLGNTYFPVSQVTSTVQIPRVSSPSRIQVPQISSTSRIQVPQIGAASRIQVPQASSPSRIQVPQIGSSPIIPQISLSPILRVNSPPIVPQISSPEFTRVNSQKFTQVNSPKIPQINLPPIVPRVSSPPIVPRVSSPPPLIPRVSSPSKQEVLQFNQGILVEATQIVPREQNVKDLSYAALNPYKLIVFDFDCTISRIHTCATKLNQNDAQLESNKIKYIGNVEADSFKELILEILSSGRFVAVASYGEKRVILNLLFQIFGLNNPFNELNVITPADISPTWPECHEPPMFSPYSKNDMLNLLTQRYRLTPTEIILLDDTGANVQRAISSGYGGYMVPKCVGFDSVVKMMKPENY